ncbi:hypothetical protein D3C71_933270 [compost metagenome]
MARVWACASIVQPDVFGVVTRLERGFLSVGERGFSSTIRIFCQSLKGSSNA